MNRTEIDEQGQREGAQQEGRTYPRRRESIGRTGEERVGGGLDTERLRAVGRNLGAQLEEQARKRPYVVIGAAAGVGFVLGSLFGSRLGQMLLAVGVGYVAKNVLEGDIGFERIQEGIEKMSGERSHA